MLGILGAGKDRNDETSCRLPQCHKGDSSWELRGSLHVFLSALQVPVWSWARGWGRGEDLSSCRPDSSRASRRRLRVSIHRSSSPRLCQVRGDIFCFLIILGFRRFGGYPMTHNQWEQEMKALEADLVYDRHKYQPGQYYTGRIDVYSVHVIILYYFL